MNPLLEMYSKDSTVNLKLTEMTSMTDLLSHSYVVYQDIYYFFKLSYRDDIIELEFMVNNEIVDISWTKKDSCYFIEINRDSPLFLLTYGITEIIVHITLLTGDEKYFFSPLLSVAVKKENEDSMDSLYEMLDTIYHRNNLLLYQSKQENESCMQRELKRADNKLEEEIDILLLILQALHKNFPYFLNNPHMVTESKYHFDSIDKLKIIDSKNIQHIITHPDELRAVYSNNGITINRNKFIPNKTLVGTSEYTCATYENRIIISFIWTLYMYIKTRKEEITALLKKSEIDISEKMETKNEYILCSKIIQQYIQIAYTKYEEKYSEFQKQYSAMYTKYSTALIKERTILTRVPEPTPVFLELYHYRNVFQIVNLWFGRSNEKIPKKNTLLQFSNADKIYEYYCLLGIYDILVEMGYKESLTDRARYEYDNNYSKFMNTEADNTFYFFKDNIEIVLYYQPVIYSGQSKTTNNIDLFRTDKHFFTPDFILKKRIKNEITYGILDAKWRNRNTLLNKKTEGGMRDFIYKYFFSVVDSNNMKNVEFLWLLQGKDDRTDMDMWIHRSGNRSRLQNEKFRLASGIVRFTPKSGNKELKKIMYSFLVN